MMKNVPSDEVQKKDNVNKNQTGERVRCTWRKHVVAVALILALAAVLELLIFNYSGLTGGYDAITLTAEDIQLDTVETLAALTADERDKLEVEQENARILAEYYGTEYVDPLPDNIVIDEDDVWYQRITQTVFTISLDEAVYIKKLAITLPLEETGGYSLTAYLEGDQVGSSFYTSINEKIDTGVTNVGLTADTLTGTLSLGENEDVSAISVEISNSVRFSTLRMGNIAVTLLLAYAIIVALCSVFGKKKNGAAAVGHDGDAINGGADNGIDAGAMSQPRITTFAAFLSRRTEWAFAILAVTLGCLLITGIGTNQISYDEYVHAKAAYKLSFSTTIETTEAAMQMVGNNLPFFNNPEERELIEAYEDLVNDPDYIAPDIGHQSRIVRAESRVYYPMAVGFFIGRMLGLRFSTMVALAKLGNLLCYVFICFWAVKLSKGYKALTAAVALLPNSIFMASALSYDPLVNSCLLLGYVLLLNEFLEPERRIKPFTCFAMLTIFVIGCLTKPIYILMAWMLLFLPDKKFANKKAAWMFRVALIGLAALMIYDVFFPTPVTGSDYALVSNRSYSGDKRNVGSSTSGQMSYILEHPVFYTKLLISEVFGWLADYTVLGVAFIGYAYLGTISFVTNWVVILTGVFAALAARTKSILKAPINALTHLMNFGVAAVVCTSMYISYTSVGNDTILGVQGRYFIPLFLPFLGCLFIRPESKFGQWLAPVREKEGLVEAIVLGVMGVVSLLATWQLVILSMNV